MVEWQRARRRVGSGTTGIVLLGISGRPMYFLLLYLLHLSIDPVLGPTQNTGSSSNLIAGLSLIDAGSSQDILRHDSGEQDPWPRRRDEF